MHPSNYFNSKLQLWEFQPFIFIPEMDNITFYWYKYVDSLRKSSEESSADSVFDEAETNQIINSTMYATNETILLEGIPIGPFFHFCGNLHIEPKCNDDCKFCSDFSNEMQVKSDNFHLMNCQKQYVFLVL